MTLKSHAKFKEKLTCGLESDMKNLTIFIRTLESVKIGIFNGILLSNAENAWAEFYRRVTSMTLKNDEKSEEKLTCGFKIDVKNLKTFNSRTWKSQKFTL